LVIAGTVLVTPSAKANDSAKTILKAMSDYVASQKAIQVSFDTDIEVITSDLQKIQFTSSGSLLLSRPDKLRATRTGGYADLELVFDGKVFTLYGKNLNSFTQVEAPGSTDQLFERLRGELGVELPGSDLLLTKSLDVLMDGVHLSQHIGRGVIDGVECEHLAFRATETDWQIWIELGARPIPRKFVITNKGVNGGPQYTLRIKEWKTDPAVGKDSFAFTPSAGATKVGLSAMPGLDEVPPGFIK
jgi:hypothetical protein